MSISSLNLVSHPSRFSWSLSNSFSLFYIKDSWCSGSISIWSSISLFILPVSAINRETGNKGIRWRCMQFVYSQFHQKHVQSLPGFTHCAISFTFSGGFLGFPGSNLYILKFRPALQQFRPVYTSVLPRKLYSNLCSAC